MAAIFWELACLVAKIGLDISVKHDVHTPVDPPLQDGTHGVPVLRVEGREEQRVHVVHIAKVARQHAANELPMEGSVMRKVHRVHGIALPPQAGHKGGGLCLLPCTVPTLHDENAAGCFHRREHAVNGSNELCLVLVGPKEQKRVPAPLVQERKRAKAVVAIDLPHAEGGNAGTEQSMRDLHTRLERATGVDGLREIGDEHGGPLQGLQDTGRLFCESRVEWLRVLLHLPAYAAGKVYVRGGGARRDENAVLHTQVHAKKPPAVHAGGQRTCSFFSRLEGLAIRGGGGRSVSSGGLRWVVTMDFELSLASKRFEKENARRKQAEKRRLEKLQRDREFAEEKRKEFEAAAAEERALAAQSEEKLRARHDALLEQNKGVFSSQRLRVRGDTSAHERGIRRRADKVSLPPSFGAGLVERHNAALHGAMFFEVAWKDRITHAALLAFDSPEGTVGMPPEMMRAMGMGSAAVPEEVTVTYRTLKPGTYAKLQPVSSGFQRDVGDIKTALELELEKHATLSGAALHQGVPPCSLPRRPLPDSPVGPSPSTRRGRDTLRGVH